MPCVDFEPKHSNSGAEGRMGPVQKSGASRNPSQASGAKISHRDL